MKLDYLLEGVRLAGASAPLPDCDVTGLEYDSRRVQPGNLFWAFAGARADGRRFAHDAAASGASAVVSELEPVGGLSIPWIRVEHARTALAVASKRFFGKPDEKLGITGITGTNGKTTTSYLVDAVLRTSGYLTGIVGTIEYHLAGRILKAANTTPESLDLFRMFDELVRESESRSLPGAMTMEVSSHALTLGRTHGIRFHTAVFTNLTRDHLDFHGTMENYFAAKRMLFLPGPGSEPAPAFAVLNRDDSWAAKISPPSGVNTLWYGVGPGADYRAEDVQFSFTGMQFRLRTPFGSFEVGSPLTGLHNVYNILAAVCTGVSYSIDMPTVVEGIAACRNVPGRFERIDQGQPFMVVVDYAHTDDALSNLIAVARGLKPRRVITVFGCGGDRDRNKRPLMGMAAASGSDFVVLTSDNPRSEDPLAIINDALVGLRRFDTPHIIEADREKAIDQAIREAGPGDIVLIAGKGHETYQVLPDRTIDFDDRETARAVLLRRGYRG